LTRSAKPVENHRVIDCHHISLKHLRLRLTRLRFA
jgi:hypothetical protein